jgi:periplasmic divalent cation tolerance protein
MDTADPDRRPARPVPEPVRIRPPNTVLVVYTTLPDEESAQEVADVLVGERLAACVSILGGCRSVYRWQGQVESAEEVPLLIKTAADRYPALQARLRELHSYDVPEILAWRPDAGWPDYASWVISETRPLRHPAGPSGGSAG